MPEGFITGQVVALRQPDVQKDVMEGEWHSWFNDQKITAYLTHGVRPVSREQERDIIASELDNPNTLLFSIVDLATGKHIGVTGLKSIDHINRSAEINIVMGHNRPPGAALEAMALLTKHAFDRLNLHKVYAGQHESLWKWVNSLLLIGYRIDGFREEAGWRNGTPYGMFFVSISAAKFYDLQRERDGNIVTKDGPVRLMTSRSSLNPSVELRRTLNALEAAAKKDTNP